MEPTQVQQHKKRARQELNPQPTDPKSAALSIELRAQRLYFAISAQACQRLEKGEERRKKVILYYSHPLSKKILPLFFSRPASTMPAWSRLNSIQHLNKPATKILSPACTSYSDRSWQCWIRRARLACCALCIRSRA